MFNFDKDVAKIGGWLTREEGIFLYNSAKGVPKDGKIVEIGSWKGRSTICLGNGSKDGHGAKIYAIDPHTGSSEITKKLGKVNTYNEFLINIKRAGVEKVVVPIKEKSETASFKIKSPVNFIFVDGAHEYSFVKQDFDLWFPKLINGGKIVFHDCWHMPGVHLFTALLLLTSNKVQKPKLLDTMTIIEKTDKNSLIDRLENIKFVLYRALVGWVGTVKIDQFGTVIN